MMEQFSAFHLQVVLVFGDGLCEAMTGTSSSAAFCQGTRGDPKNLAVAGLSTARASLADIWKLMNDLVYGKDLISL